MITPAELYDAIDETWPAARFDRLGPWILREGQGGGKRVSATTANAPVSETNIADAEILMQYRGQRPLFMLRDGDNELDDMLAARRYASVDPTNGYAIPVGSLTDVPVPRVTVFSIWEPLAIMTEIWAKGGIGPARMAVMGRAGSKTGILARWNEKPAGTAFVALHDRIAMVHAVEVLPDQRRQGVAQWIMRHAAFWARDHGADTLAVLCTDANVPANRLYQELGFHKLCSYHYRQHPEDT